jgi:hypothetical protein
MIGRMDYLPKCKLHEIKFPILQIGDKWSQRVQMSPRLSPFSRKFPDCWIHAKRNIFRILHLPEFAPKRSGNGKYVDYLM